MKKKGTFLSIFHPGFNVKKANVSEDSSNDKHSLEVPNSVPGFNHDELSSSRAANETAFDLNYGMPSSSMTGQCSIGINKEIDKSENYQFHRKGLQSDQKCDIPKPSRNESLRKKKVSKESFDSCSQLSRFSNSRAEIEEVSDRCCEEFFKEKGRFTETYKDFQLGHSKFPFNLFEKHLQNLDLQHKEFGKFVSSTMTRFTVSSTENNCNDTESIIKTLYREAKIFQNFFPAYGLRDKILSEIRENQVTIITADCACLLNTALPLMLGNIYENHTILSCEKNEILSQLLQKRINSIFSSDEILSNLKVLSEGELLKKFSFTKLFSDFNFYVIYNISLKRSLITDINLANLRDLLANQKDLKLILLLSPYDDVAKFKLYFSSNVALLDLPSQCFPVKTTWKEAMLSPNDNFNDDVANTVFAIHVLYEPGDIIVFLPSTKHVQSVYEELDVKIHHRQYNDLKVFCTDDSLDNFLPTCKNNTLERRVFLLTSGYEGVIIPSSRYVVDCGIQEEYSFDSEMDNNILTSTFISQVRAKQRKQVAGTFSAGICFRLYNKANFLQNMYLKEHAELFCISPIHSMVKVFEHRPYKGETIHFIESLPNDVQKNTLETLKTCGAFDEDSHLTYFGKQIVKLPFPVKYSRLILFGIRWGYAYEAVILVAFFSVKKRLFVESQNEEQQKLMDVTKLNFNQFDSDTLTYLSIFKMWKANGFKKLWCQKNYIDFETLKNIRLKVNEMCHVINENIGEEIRQEFSDDSQPDNLFQMLFECFQSNLCSYTGHHRTGYKILASKQFALVHPSSFLYQRDYPRFIIYEDLVPSDPNYIIYLTCIPFDFVVKYLQEGILKFNSDEIFEDQLVERVIDGVGEKVINRVLLADNGRKAKEIEDDIKTETGAKVILLDPLLEKGCVNVYAYPNDINQCVISLDNILKDYIKKMLKEEEYKVIQFRRGQNNVRFEVKWTKGAETVSSEQILMNSHSVSNNKVSSDAVTKSESIQTSIKYSIKLMWTRRFCSGEGYLNLKNQNDFNHARKLAYRYIQVAEYEVFVQLSEKKPNQLRLSDIAPEVTEEDLKKAFGGHLSCEFEIELCYRAPFITSSSELLDMKKQIEENCRNQTNLRNFDVQISMPNPDSKYMNASVNVFETRCLDKEAYNLSSSKVNNMKLSCTPLYSSDLKCSVKVYNALYFRIKMEVEIFNHEYNINEGKRFSFRVYPSDDDTMNIKFSSGDIEIVKSLQLKINDLLRGIVLDKNNVRNIHKLFCHGGHVHLKNLESSKNVLIIQNFETKTIRLYGEEENCNFVRQDISYFLDETDEKTEEIVLPNRTVLKALITQYGVNLEKFIELFSLRSAALDIKTSVLILYGRRENIEQAMDSINELSASSDSDGSICSSLLFEEICPVCACAAENLTIRLEHCGHVYCSGCIQALIEQGNFPIQCCAENCSKDIILEDIKHVLSNDADKIDELAEKSLKAYLEKNREKIFFCPAPDCSMFVHKSELKESKWNCPLCGNSICTQCNVVYHEGYSCDMYRGSRDDPDYSFKVWQKNKTKDCKICPNCGSAIEKRDGCNHMTCTVCRCHFCWICGKKFNTGNEVYAHIEAVHTGRLFAH